MAFAMPDELTLRVTRQAERAEIVLKLDYPACRISYEGRMLEIAAESVPAVLDTTAAGDSFAAAYLSARLAGFAPATAARAGHALAGAVVQHRGAMLIVLWDRHHQVCPIKK